MPGWLLGAIAYIVVTGTLGVTSKLALRHLSSGDLLVWTAVAYAVAAAAALAMGAGHLTLGQGSGLAFLSGLLAAASLIALFIALSGGRVSVVVPITSAYPLVAVALGIAILHERFSAMTVVGAAVVVIGVALIATAR